MKNIISACFNLSALTTLLVTLGACSDAEFQSRSGAKKDLSTSFRSASTEVTIDGQDGADAHRTSGGTIETDTVGDAAGKVPGQTNDQGKMKSCQKMALEVSHAEGENATGKGTADAQGDQTTTYVEVGDGYVIACASSSSSSGGGSHVTASSDTKTP